MKINITSADGIGANCSVTTEDGTPINGITEAHIHILGPDPIRAELKFFMPPIKFKNLSVSVSEEHLRELAAAQGFDLVKRG